MERKKGEKAYEKNYEETKIISPDRDRKSVV